MKILSTSFVLLLLVVSCGASKSSNSNQEEKTAYKKIALTKLGDNITYVLNETKTYVLCIKETKGTVQQPRNSIKYLVVKISDNAVALESTVDGGTVKWYNLKMVQVYQTPGIMRDDQTKDDFITLYNVETGKSYPKNQKETH